MITTDDYKKEVFDFYKQKKDASDPSFLLRDLKPASIRKTCLTVFKDRFLQKDEWFLKSFFGVPVNKGDYTKKIESLPTAKFRPLQNFLNDPSIDTSKDNIELLAWLTDFEPRPFDIFEKRRSNSSALPVDTPPPTEILQEGQTVINPVTHISEEITSEPETKETGISIKPTITVLPKNSTPKNTFTKKVLIAAAAAIVIATFIFILIRITLANQSCMYWNGDRYVKISCNEHMSQAQVIALDTQVLRHFKRITTPDTITLKSVGAVWYIKQNGQLEFFTAEGNHPTDPNIHLRPVTDYIIRKYIHPFSDTTK